MACKDFVDTGENQQCCVFKWVDGKHSIRSKRAEGNRCPHEARPDQLYCKCHDKINHLSRSLKRFPMAYRVLSKVLTRRLEQINEDCNEMIHLRYELDLVRAAAVDSIEAYDQALELVELAQGAEDKTILETARGARDAAADAMRDALKHVRMTALDAARVEALSAAQYSPVAVREILTQVIHIVHDACKDHVDGESIAAAIDLRMREQIKVGEATASTTSLTPDVIDAEVLDMDSTVPRALEAQ